MLKRPHILVVGSFMMDLIATTERAPGPGETVAGTGFRTAPGGKGANQAVQCARLGAHVTMAGRVGDDAFGREALQSVRTAGVDLSRVTADPSAPTGVAHILVEDTPQGVQNRITIVPGANFTLTPADLAWMEDGVRAFDMVLLQFELPMDVVEAAAGWAHAAGVPVMVNPAPAAPISDRLLACADYLSPNEHEAAQLPGLPLRAGPEGVEAADLERVAAWFRARGVKELLVTLGENGAALAGTEGMLRVPCVPMERVADPTAAGDSFVGAFCTGLCAGLEREAALAFASHAAALTVFRMGAQPSLPTLGEVQTLLRERGCRSVDPAALDPLAE